MEMRQKNVLMSVVVTKYAAMMGVLLNVSAMLQNQVIYRGSYMSAYVLLNLL